MQPKKKKIGTYIMDPNEFLGSGQYGKVYKAVDKSKGIIAAVKVIDKKLINDDEYTKNAIVREIQTMKNLKSPNVIELLEVHETQNNVYIIQELADQGTLRTLMKDHPTGFNEEIALIYIMQLVNGFRELSKHGIIHRDIKPTNILVKNKVLKLADFGFSRYSDKMGFMNSIVGTPAYMAPQVLNREIFEKYTYKCDIWSFGVVCYELLVGYLPWKIQTNNLDDLYRVIKDGSTGGVKFPSDKKISKDLKDLIRGCLQFEEKDRLDWTQILGNPVFKGKFEGEATNFDEEAIQQVFALTRLRLSVHSKNINLQKQLDKMPKELNFEDFLVIMKMLDQEITSSEAKCIFLAIEKKRDFITEDQLLKHFAHHGIKISGLKNLEKKQSVQQSEIDRKIQKLGKTIQQKNIDLYDLYKSYDRKKKNGLSLQQFAGMINEIDKSISVEEVKEMFKAFDVDKNKEISFDECYRMLCKMTQVCHVHDKDLRQSIRKIQQKKR